MSDLQASIQSLTQMAALIPNHVGNLTQELTAVHTAFDEFMAKVQDKQTQAASVLSHIQVTFHEFEQELAQHHIQLEQEFNGIENDVDNLEKFITESKDQAHQEIEASQQKLGTWKTQLASNHSAIETAREAAQSAIAELHTKIQNDKTQLETAVSASHQEIDELIRHQLSAVKTEVGSDIDHMVQEMETSEQGIVAKIHDFQQSVDHLSQELNEHLASTSHSIIHGETDYLLQELHHQIVETLQQQVDNALHQVIDALDHTHDSSGSDGSHLSDARTELEKPIHEAERTVEIVKKAIMSVIHFAERFGHSLGINI